MKSELQSPVTVDDYIAGFPPDIQRGLAAVRQTIRKAAPEATEAIKYRIPTFVLRGNLVHFAAFKNHLGFYPAPSAIRRFAEELSSYPCAKGSVQFPWNRPVPLTLITKMVQFRVAEAAAATLPAGGSRKPLQGKARPSRAQS